MTRETPASASRSELLARLAAIVGAKHVLTDAADKAGYLVEPRDLYKGEALCIVRPQATAEVAAILALCHETATKLVPQGGNTGLVGGQIPFEQGDEIVLSLTRLNRLREIDPASNTMIVEAGMTAGAIGFSTSRSESHRGAFGRPVPSRLAELSEIWTLAEAVGASGRGTIEATWGPDFHVEECARLATDIGRPVTWAALSGFAGYTAYVASPVYYDYGESVVYSGDTVIINGEQGFSADLYAQQAIACAHNGCRAVAGAGVARELRICVGGRQLQKHRAHGFELDIDITTATDDVAEIGRRSSAGTHSVGCRANRSRTGWS